MGSSAVLMGLTSALASGLFVITDIVFLVLVLTTVRRQRPDAWLPLAAAIGVALFTTVLSVVSGLVGSMFVSSSGGMDSYLHYTMASHAFLAMTGLVGRVLFIVGVLRLARDPFVPPPGPQF